MAVLGLSGAVIYLLPFLREVYYDPLREALNLTHSQSGRLMATFGFVSMLTYMPGGWVADRVPSRLLISGSLISTGLLGFAFATFPSYPVALAIHALWGVTITGMMWGALIKATRDWASSAEQGKAFGMLEAGRGVSEAACYSIFLAVFAQLGGDTRAFSQVIIQYSILHVLLGVAAFFVIKPGLAAPTGAAPDLATFFRVLKMPHVWLIGFVILSVYGAYWGAYYFTPYASDVFLMSAVAAGAIGAGKVWLKPASAAIAGLVADRIGVSKAVLIGLFVLTVSFLGFTVLPGGQAMIGLMIFNIALASITIFALRGIYFALLEDCGVPAAVTGTATGIVSVIAFTPDVFMPLVGGALLDAYPGETGFRYFFGLITALCICGGIAMHVLKKLGRAS
ncbi:MFS transporter [Hyphococcus sp.]|uniref:MFS transporter n=1 Tax=Hyphococcus sp. TaxID=2038636 RepID=UPI003D09628F